MRAMSLLAIGIERQNLRGRWEQFQKLVNEALAIARALPSDGYWEVQKISRAWVLATCACGSWTVRCTGCKRP